MIEAELIARQAKQIEELRDEVADLKKRASKAKMHIYCIGGPLNDNKLGYSREQMVTFARIATELDGGYSCPSATVMQITELITTYPQMRLCAKNVAPKRTQNACRLRTRKEKT